MTKTNFTLKNNPKAKKPEMKEPVELKLKFQF